MKYVALLRGINVGGNHLIKMADLKACFEAQRLRDVATYIQSGQVVFTATARPAEIVRRLEAAIQATFDCRTSVMLRSRKEMEQIVARAPKGFGAQPEKYRYDVVFLNPPLTAEAALAKVAHQAGRGRGARGRGRALFLAPDQQGGAEPAAARRLDADLQEHDDPQLAHDHDAAPDDDGRRRGELNVLLERPAARSPPPPLTGPGLSALHDRSSQSSVLPSRQTPESGACRSVATSVRVAEPQASQTVRPARPRRGTRGPTRANLIER